jgi:NitT/TauT family transport system ATP-binding protein
MVFQHAELLPWLSALQNVMFGLEMKGMRGAVLRETAEKYLHLVGLKDSQNRRPHQLSGGMKQRVGIARALAIDPKVLLMDEPFGALDAQTKLQLEDVLLSLWQREKRTVVFITHDLSEAVSMSDRVIVMSARPGRIIADVPIDLGRPRSVRALQKDHAYHELYSQVWSKLEEGLTQ